MRNSNRDVREFGDFRIDLAKKVLWHSDEPVHLPAKAVELLCVLVENRGEVVSKDELLERVWQGAYVEESVLSQNIHQLRKTFRDLKLRENPIQTIPRRGYRFAGGIDEVEDGLVIEREVVEQTLLAEISEDSLKDLDSGKIAAFKNRRASLPGVAPFNRAVTAVLLMAMLVGLAVWVFERPDPTGPRREIGSIAVLPLKYLSPEYRNQTFSLGLTDSLISCLGKLNRFAVRPFSAVENYEKSGKDAIGFGRQLRVDAVLEGTIQRDEDRLRVNLRLIDVETGQQMWADNFDETASDLLRLQDSISGKVARFLVTKLGPEEEIVLTRRPTNHQEAYRHYLTGREIWLKRDWTTDCLAFYRRALELDPNFALPYVGIADFFAFTNDTGKAEEALNRAIELDPELAEAYATRGFLQMFHHWDWARAESSFRRAIELAPHSSKAHHWYGVYFSLRGRFGEARREMEKALELDPTALIILADLAELSYFQRDYDRAESELEKVLEIDPNFLNARMYLTKVRYKKGASFYLESARFELFLRKKMESDSFGSEQDTVETERHLAGGNEKALRDNAESFYIEDAPQNPSSWLGLARNYLIEGEKEKSLEALEKACRARVFLLPFVAVDPIWDPVRHEPRFQAVLQQMNLING